MSPGLTVESKSVHFFPLAGFLVSGVSAGVSALTGAGDGSSMPIWRFLRAILLFLRTAFFALLAACWTSSSFSLITSALALWMDSTRTFLASRYLLRSLLRTRDLLIHRICSGIRALRLPFLRPLPLWRPLRFCSAQALARERECIVV